MRRISLRTLGLVVLCGMLVGVLPAFAQDTLTIGTVTSTSGTGNVLVPVYIRDASGTPLGLDQPVEHRINGLAMLVTYGPLACVTNTTVQSNAANGLFGTFKDNATCGSIFEYKVKVAGTSQTYVFNAPEHSGTDPCGAIPFTLDAAAPGDHVVDFQFTLNACPLGTVIPLAISVSGGNEATFSSDSGVSETNGNGLNVVSGQITIPAPTLTLSPKPLNIVTGGGGQMTATMSFSLASDTIVTLSSSDPTKATVPATATILAGQTSVNFTVTGVAAGSSTITATLPAAAGGASDTATVNVAPVTITLSPKPLGLAVGTTGNMTATINPVMTSDTVITLGSSDPTKATVPASVTILANQASAQFVVTAVAVGSTTVTATLPAGLGSGTDTAAVNVTPVSVTLSPKPLGIYIGGTGTMTATLSTTQATATTVTLGSSDPTKATVPATMTIPANQISATFTVTGVGVGASTITATLPVAMGSGSDTATVNVNAVAIALAPKPLNVVVGGTGQMTITITPAQATATTVTLASSDPTKATVPASINVPVSGSVNFPVTAVAVGSTTITATLPASLGSAADTATANVTGITVALTPDPLTMTVAGTGQFTVTLSSTQPSVTTVTLGSSDPTKVTVPASVNVPANTASATFTANAVAVGSSTITATLPAGVGGATDTATANVVAVSLLSLTGPGQLLAGQTAQGTATISAVAPAGGIVIDLSVVPSGIVTIPATVTVPEGATSAQFDVTGVSPGTATVTGSFGGTQHSFVVMVVSEIPTLSGIGLLLFAALLAAGALFFIRSRMVG